MNVILVNGKKHSPVYFMQNHLMEPKVYGKMKKNALNAVISGLLCSLKTRYVMFAITNKDFKITLSLV